MSKSVISERIILGIDPGTTVTGYGIIRSEGNQLTLMNYGIIDLRKMGTDHALKLRKIFERTLSLIDEFHPDEFAIEAQFFGKNVQSMLKLGRAQGVAIAAALFRDIPIVEYAPKKVKMAVTGNGNASKLQVNGMLEKLLKFNYDDKLMDASDGIAVAVCHYLQKGFTANTSKTALKGTKGKKVSSWKAFVSDQPGRVKKRK